MTFYQSESFADQPEIYIIIDGAKRHIPDPTTYNNLFATWGDVREALDLPSITTGHSLTHGAYLFRGDGEAAVYLIDGNKKRHVTSPDIMSRYGFDWNKVRSVPASVVAAIETGAPLS